MENRFSRLEVRESAWKTDKELRKMMEDAGDVETFEGIVEVTNGDAYDGCYEDIENYCISKDIAFDRFTEVTLEIESFIRAYRPAEDSGSIDVTVTVNLLQRPYVQCEDLLNILKMDVADELKLLCFREVIRNNNFPCPLIEYYRSQAEKKEEVAV